MALRRGELDSDRLARQCDERTIDKQIRDGADDPLLRTRLVGEAMQGERMDCAQSYKEMQENPVECG